ncbi:hypothetical protein DAI22_08g243300 [Oryza sativa Japonica Group]|nr:hypothetical protein DAI22_08g243300 [Oryza sativa Japonica Group]
MPLRDAARAACLSRAFLHSWRCRPNLTLTREVFLPEVHSLHSHIVNASDIIDGILRNRSGSGVKILKLQLEGISLLCLDRWLKLAVTPMTEELIVMLCTSITAEYNFPCSVLSSGIRSSIRLSLHFVHVTEDELECFLSNSTIALEQLNLSNCEEIICLKIPCVLQKLSCLVVAGCCRLRVIESNAPNLSSLSFSGNVKLSLGDPLQVKRLSMIHPKVVCYARAELPSVMPNLETLAIYSNDEVVNTPMLPTKFLYLKHLTISVSSAASFNTSYDYFSLVSFLDASPSLETLILNVSQEHMKHESVLGDSSPLRQMPEHRHCYLKSVKMTGFSSAKNLIELTCYILKNAVSLECLTLDTLYERACSLVFKSSMERILDWVVSGAKFPISMAVYIRLDVDAGCSENSRRCYPMGKSVVREAHRAVRAVTTYIQDKVPDTVKFTVQSYFLVLFTCF